MMCTKNANGNYCAKLFNEFEDGEEANICTISSNLGCCLGTLAAIAEIDPEIDTSKSELEALVGFCGVSKLPLSCPLPGETVTVIRTGFTIDGVSITVINDQDAIN